MGEGKETLELCNTVQKIMRDATRDLPIPAPNKSRAARKRISVFTYGVISKLSVQSKLNKDDVYREYLMMGGLNTEQANIIVRRTRDEFTQQEFGKKCFTSGEDAVKKWVSGDKKIQSLVAAFL